MPDPVDLDGAEISPCGAYRYRLWRSVGDGEYGTVAFIMLNPSTADARTDDPTIRRCKSFARRWGYSRLVVGNLFGYRATSPNMLIHQADPFGPGNRQALNTISLEADRIVVAWGGNPIARMRDAEDLALAQLPNDVWCLGTTQSDAPRHPLYVRADTPLRRL